MSVEVDFPRGGTIANPPPAAANGSVAVKGVKTTQKPLKKHNKSRDHIKKTKKETAEPVYTSVNKYISLPKSSVVSDISELSVKTDNILSTTIKDGIMMMGAVSSVQSDHVLLQLPCGMRGIVRTATDTIEGVQQGDMLAVYVKGAAAQGPVSVTLSPSLLNKHLSVSSIKRGFFLAGRVLSVEDRGYTVDIGIPKATALLVKTARTMEKGQPFIAVVQAIETSGRVVILLSTLPSDMEHASPGAWKDLLFSSVLPGTLAKCVVKEVFSNGISVKFMDSVVGFVPASDLPHPPSHFPPGFKVTGRVTYIDDVTRRVGLTVSQALVKYTQPKIQQGIIGTIFKGALVLWVDDEFSLVELPCTPPIVGALYYSRVNKPKQELVVGDRIECTVIETDYLRGRPIISLSTSTLGSGATSSSNYSHNLVPGAIVSGTIVNILSQAVQIKLDTGAGGLARCASLHLADIPVSKIDSMFSIDDRLTCRILSIEGDSKIYLTNKATLVNSPYRQIAAYHTAVTGAVAHGWVSKVSSLIGVTVCFYGGIFGLVPASDIEGDPTTMYHEGQVVLTKVVKCQKMKEGQQPYTITLTMKMEYPPEPILNTADVHDLLVSTSFGSFVDGVVSICDNKGLTVQLDNGLTAYIPVSHMSDQPTHCHSLLGSFPVGSRIGRSIVLNKDRATQRLFLSRKPSLLKAAALDLKKGEDGDSSDDDDDDEATGEDKVMSEASNFKSFPVIASEIQPKTVLYGHVRQVSAKDCVIGFAGTCRGTVTAKCIDGGNTGMMPSDVVELGQTVRTFVHGFHNKFPVLNLLSSYCATDGLDLLSVHFADIKILRQGMEIFKKYKQGQVVQAVVQNTRTGLIVSIVGDNVPCHVSLSHIDLPLESYKKGDQISAMILDYDDDQSLFELSLLPDLVKKQINNKYKPQEDQYVEAKIELVKPTHLLLSISTGKSIVFGYAPVSDYNTLTTHKVLAYTIGQKIQVRASSSFSDSISDVLLFALQEKIVAAEEAAARCLAAASTSSTVGEVEDAEEDEEQEQEEEEGDEEEAGEELKEVKRPLKKRKTDATHHVDYYADERHTVDTTALEATQDSEVEADDDSDDSPDEDEDEYESDVNEHLHDERKRKRNSAAPSTQQKKNKKQEKAMKYQRTAARRESKKSGKTNNKPKRKP